MKKLLVLIGAMFLVSAFIFAGNALAVKSQNKKFSLPENAREVSPGVYSLGTAKHNGEIVEGFAIIDYKKGYNHNPNHNGGSNGGTTSSCFAYFAKGAKWKTTEPYLLDSANNDGLSESFIASITEAGIDAWDSQVSFDVFGPRVTGVVDGPDSTSPDEKNELIFGSLSDPNTIAVTTVWGIFSGPISQRKIVEWDMVLNDAYVFGDADVDSSLMDYQNIFTHEIGHAAGMSHPSDACTQETMYRFASEGETKKRTLNTGDISGVKGLYN